MIKKIHMANLMCSGCASKIEKELMKQSYINNATFNFTNQVMLIDVTTEYIENTAIIEIKKIVDSIETGVETYLPNKKVETTKKVNYINTFSLGLILFFITLYIQSKNDYEILVPLLWTGYLMISNKILLKTLKGIKRKDYFNENTLMLVATVVAMILGEFTEAILVVLFYTFGEYLQNQAVKKSKGEIKGLLDLKIEYAYIEKNHNIIIKSPEEVEIDDIIVIKKGDKVPVDGTVIEGDSLVNTSAITGESVPRRVKAGSEILSGNINTGNTIRMKATKIYSDSTIYKIIDLIENSTNKKAAPENFITKFARVYTPTIAILALLMFLIPTILNPSLASEYLYRAAIFLVISCPCALVLSIPLTYFSGIGASARNGILFKGSNYLDMLNDIDVIAVDKTGTLTKGNFVVTEYTNEETLLLAASIEQYSNHPIAKSIIEKYPKKPLKVTNTKEISGKGMIGYINNDLLIVGNTKLLSKYKIDIPKVDANSTSVLVAYKNQFIGQILIKDEIKESAKFTIDRLHQPNITMLTGDNDFVASSIANELGIDYRCNLLPGDKITEFEKLESNSFKMFVGDGINDAPLLKQADIGVAMGQGSELAIDVADLIIMDDDLTKLITAKKIAKKTKTIVIQNIALTIGLKLLIVSLSAFGLSSMLGAIFADVGVSLIAVLNSLRIIYSKDIKTNPISTNKKAIDIFKLCSNITVFSILETLASNEKTLEELQNTVKDSYSTVNKKIDLLVNKNIVTHKTIDGKTYYYLKDKHVVDLIKIANKHLACN